MDDTLKNLHRQVWNTIPWVVAGSASDAERQLVLQHTAGCADCRDELAFHRNLRAGMAPSADAETTAVHDPEPALRRLMAQIAEADGAPADAQPGTETSVAAGTPAMARQPAAPNASLATSSRSANMRRWLAAAVVVQAIGIAALTGALWERPSAAAYETLSRPSAPSAASIRLVPDPQLTLVDLQALLARSGLQIVDSSGDGAILGVAPRPGSTATVGETLLRLRAEPGVRLAEPVLDAAAPRP